ncbi:MAG: C-GCAxxG-C-C family protein [Candidatus Gastranaerophilales bacterium]|nr:C-GCAxxG-C-C family protein [Candidatus Gastranaerophilales bacterium]
MKEQSVKYFMQGYSCSESIVKAAADKGYISQEALAIATAFSGGMGIKCVCGAVAGAAMVIGAMFGRNDKDKDGMKARALVKEFNEIHAQKYKVNCCKVLSAGFEFHSPERKQHCAGMVADCSQILEDLLKRNITKVSAK